MKLVEKLDPGKDRVPPATKRWYKKLLRRQRRRAEARDPENVRRQFTRGHYL